MFQSFPTGTSIQRAFPAMRILNSSLAIASMNRGCKRAAFTMDNTVMEMKDDSLMMKIINKTVEKKIAKGFGGKADYSDPSFHMMMASAADASLFGMKINGGMKNGVLEGMLEFADGNPLRGIYRMMGMKYGGQNAMKVCMIGGTGCVHDLSGSLGELEHLSALADRRLLLSSE